MFGLLQIYIFFNLHFILIKCDPSQELSVRITDQKLIERKRQDTRDMCKIFNSEVPKASLPTEALPVNKYDKRKKELKLKEKKEEIQNKKTHRIKRAVNSINPALNVEDEQRVETIVDKIYDDLLEKGQNIAYRRKLLPKAELPKTVSPRQKAKGYTSAANKPGRRFPFAPSWLDDGTTTIRSDHIIEDLASSSKQVRFSNAIVPYFIDATTYDTHLAEIITKAFDYFEKATCIRLQRLREKPRDQRSLQNVTWLYITNPSGIRQCVHSNERAEIQGVQTIAFGYDCMSVGDISHEIMHVLGFGHEHVRPDRDKYITILWENIKPGYKQYFEVHNETKVEGLPYDYASVLHYPPRAFSRNGKVTILTERGIKIGQREALSEMDLEKIGILYANECVKRNREYLLKTCPSVVQPEVPPRPVTQQEIDDYFKDRLWPLGVVTYRFNAPSEFSTEEIENIKAVINHIGNETCVQFQEHSYSKPIAEDRRGEDSGSDEDNRADDRSSSSYNFDSEDLQHVVILAVSGENDTKGISDSTSSEIAPHLMPLSEEIEDPDVAAVGLRAKNNSGGAKVKTKNVIRKPTVLRRKRARPTPARRHAGTVLVLSRSSKPGCPCPQPGNPDGPFLNDDIYALTINTDCFNTVNDLLHLFVHVLGLDHQHNMHDRDSYLHIVWDQLTEDVKQEMKKKLPPAASLGYPYDYQSVMHYPWLQIKNGKTNIMYPIWNDGWAMGHWQGLSTTDVQKINILYNKGCNERKQLVLNAMKNKFVGTSDDVNEIYDEQEDTTDAPE